MTGVQTCALPILSFDCADVFNFDPQTGHIASVVLVYDTHLVRDVVENKYP